MIDQHNIGLFKAAYSRALSDSDEEFTFNGKKVLTQFAKYLIEYVESIYIHQTNSQSNGH